MLKWFGIFLIALGILVRFSRQLPVAISFPVNVSTRIGYSINMIVFWILLLLGLALFVASFRSRTS
jgi:hypothetical protein